MCASPFFPYSRVPKNAPAPTLRMVALTQNPAFSAFYTQTGIKRGRARFACSAAPCTREKRMLRDTCVRTAARVQGEINFVMCACNKKRAFLRVFCVIIACYSCIRTFWQRVIMSLSFVASMANTLRSTNDAMYSCVPSARAYNADCACA